MLVSIVSPDLSRNCLGRAYVLARLVERNYEVEIVGPKLSGTIWEPIKHEYNYKGVETGPRITQFPFDVPSLLDRISGNVVYASKAQMASYGLGLLATLGRDRPLILDIDDWGTGFSYRHGKIKTLFRSVPRLISIQSYYYQRSLEALSGVADARSVSNHFLKDRFGGTLVPHAKNTDRLDPSRFDKQTVRNELDLPGEDFLMMFLGTPRRHKGVDDLAKAVATIGRDDIRTVVVGAHNSEYVDKVRQLGGHSIIIRGVQPFDEIPKWLVAADAIAIPQKDSPATWGQMPSKVFDAMAMGKPIVATDVSDMSTVLDGCGLIVEPESVPQLADAIMKLVENEEYRRDLGHRARERCVTKYSYDAVAPRIADIIKSSALSS